MPARLHTNFRRGNLAEHLGLLLLKGIAAVADVPRTEDVGIDAVATLLRRDPDGNSYAEEGFVVQFKSDSVRSIKYRDHQLSWLLCQPQPVFIGRVSKKDASISLYSTLYINQAVLALHARQVTVRLGKSEGPYPWAGGEGDSAEVWLGPPLLTWSLADIEDDVWVRSAYQTLKLFLRIARREYTLLSFGQSSQIVWSTNDRDSIRSLSLMMMKGHPDDFHTLATNALPGLNALLLHALVLPAERGTALTMSLLSAVASLRDLGVDVDPMASAFAKLFALSKQP